MPCLLDAAVALFAPSPEKEKRARDAAREKQPFPQDEGVLRLLRLREKNWEEFLACVDQPNVLFVSLIIKVAKGHIVDVMEMPFLHAHYIESELFYKCRSAKRIKASIGTGWAATRPYSCRRFGPEHYQYGWGKEYPTPDKQEEAVTQFLDKLKEHYPGRKLILAGMDLRKNIQIFEHVCPRAATYFADAIDVNWLMWSTTPEAGHLGYRDPRWEAPVYDLFDPNEEPVITDPPFIEIRKYFNLPENRAPHRCRIGPDLVVKPDPDAPFAAKIYSPRRWRLPRKMSSADSLAKWIESFGYQPVRVGTWGSLCISLRCKSTPDIYRKGHSYGWVCFEDLASLEKFIAFTDRAGSTVIDKKRVAVVSLHEYSKPASLASTETSQENQQETPSLKGTEVEVEMEVEVVKEPTPMTEKDDGLVQELNLTEPLRLGEEETTSRTEQHDDSVRELHLIEPLDLGENMDLGGLVDLTMN